jgi:alpha-tubulin suppressor-like RCC1 family protein
MLNKLYKIIIIIILIILIIIVIKVQYYFKTIEEFTAVIYVTDDRTTGKYGTTCTSCPGNCTTGNYITGSCLNNTITENKSCTPCKSTCPAGKTLSGHCDGTSTSDKQCTPCPSGQYKIGDNGNECSQHISTCESGKGLYGTNSTTSTKTCSPCQSGQYKSGDNGNECSPHISTCGSGKGLYGPSNSATRTMTCHTCPNGTYKIGDNGNRCINCPVGTQSYTDKTQCEPITELYSFGNNESGQLGVGISDWRKTIPTFIEKFYYITSYINYYEITIIEISTGAHHSLFLTNEGRVYSCGDDEMGQIGLGDNDNDPKKIPTFIEKFYNNTSYIKYDDITIIEISAGGYHSLFLTDDGYVYSCGYNYYGQLGVDDKDDKYIPTLIENLNNIRKISAGDHHSLFLTNEGRVYSSGQNDKGQLGVGNTDENIIPTLIENIYNINSYIKYDDINITQISAGGYHSLFLTNEGQVYSSGRNDKGQLGLNNTDDKEIPMLIQSFNNDDETFNYNDITIIEISAGGDHSLFLTDDGYVYSCGLNDKGQLGLNNTDDKEIPTLIENLNNIRKISAGRHHSLFLKDDGYVYSCGYNSNGQLGLNNTDDKKIPMLIENINNIRKISGGGYYSIFSNTHGPPDPPNQTIHPKASGGLGFTTGEIITGMYADNTSRIEGKTRFDNRGETKRGSINDVKYEYEIIQAKPGDVLNLIGRINTNITFKEYCEFWVWLPNGNGNSWSRFASQYASFSGDKDFSVDYTIPSDTVAGKYALAVACSHSSSEGSTRYRSWKSYSLEVWV